VVPVSTYGGVSIAGQLYNFGGVASAAVDLDLEKVYGGTNYGAIYGVTISPTITFRLNPHPDFSKTFDSMVIVGSSSPASLALNVADDASDSFNMTSQTSFVNIGEGNFRAKYLRDSSNARRMRGLSGKATLVLASATATEPTLTSVLTKYRPSFKSI